MKGKRSESRKMDERISGAEGMLYLTVCGVLEKIPDAEFLKAMDWRGVLAAGCAHSLTVLTGLGVEEAVREGVILSGEQDAVYRKWMELKNKAIRKNLLIDTERRELEAYLQQQGIWYMPLKGVVLKNMYPRSSMRQMADNDILFDAAHAKEVRDYFSSRGYEIKSFGRGNHDAYLKKPVYNFEMHRSLYSDELEEWKEYYKNIKQKLHLATGCQYAFSDEDFYVYLISHTYKHYSRYGTGVRALADVYVCLRRIGETLNWSYISEQCHILGIAEYEEWMRSLTMKVFSVKHMEIPAGWFGSSLLQTLTKEEKRILENLLGAGTYGTIENWVSNQLKQYEKRGKGNPKLLYMCKRLFPEMSFYKNYYPFFYRHKWLIPGFVVYRLGRALMFHGKRIAAEIRGLLQC